LVGDKAFRLPHPMTQQDVVVHKRLTSCGFSVDSISMYSAGSERVILVSRTFVTHFRYEQIVAGAFQG
jgi:hypothetical protein